MRDKEKEALPESQKENTQNDITGQATQQCLDSSTQTKPEALILGEKDACNPSIFACVSSIDDASLEKWPSEAVRCVRERFKRLPRNSYRTLASIYDKKFASATTAEEFKNLAVCKIKRRKKNDANMDKMSTTEARENKPKEANSNDYIEKAKSIFYKHLGQDDNAEMLERKRTHKIPDRKLNKSCIETLNIIIQQHINTTKPVKIEQVSKILYAMQQSYDELVHKLNEKSKWKDNIQGIITRCKTNIAVIKNYKEAITNKSKCSEQLKKDIKKNIQNKWSKKMGFK